MSVANIMQIMQFFQGLNISLFTESTNDLLILCHILGKQEIIIISTQLN